MQRATNPARGVVPDFFRGVGILGSGLKLWATSPKLMLIGALPAVLVGIVYLAAIIIFAINADAILSALGAFTDPWSEPWRTGTQIILGLALLGLTVVVLVYTFVAVTLTVGDPFYERIWHATEMKLGNPPSESSESAWKGLRRGIANGLRLFVVTVLIGIGLFALGFIPVVGQTVVPVLGAIVGGWFLAVELTGYAFDARGRSLKERRRTLAGSRAMTLGFGIVTYLLFLVPLGAIIVMPAAVAGATMLSRKALDRAALKA
jgi:CysZ protein